MLVLCRRVTGLHRFRSANTAHPLPCSFDQALPRHQSTENISLSKQKKISQYRVKKGQKVSFYDLMGGYLFLKSPKKKTKVRFFLI